MSTSNSVILDLNKEHQHVINLDSDEDLHSDGTLSDHELDESFVTPAPSVCSANNGHPLEAIYRQVPALTGDGYTLRPGKSVELRDGYFFRILTILEDRNTWTMHLKGLRFRRTLALCGMLELKQNELVMLSHPGMTGENTEIVEASEVLRIRDLVLTNQPFPSLSYREVDLGIVRREDIASKCRLVCRWKWSRVSEKEGFLRTLDPFETDANCGAPRLQLRQRFRGGTKEGGACASWLPGERDFDNAEQDDHALNKYTPSVVHLTREAPLASRYSFGDVFCGGGGASRGAKEAGLRVDWGLDFDPAATQSYSLNFHRTRCFGMAAHDFVIVMTEDFKVDILHLSPPCQTFSPAHTRPGSNDEMNEATFLAVGEIISKARPRVVMLEETFGLTRTLDSLRWFRALIQMFTRLGFSVRWKVFNLAQYGLSQPRKRLIVIASCPGELLPDFPHPTHGTSEERRLNPHLLPLTTIRDIISRIPPNAPFHNPESMTHFNKQPYPDNEPLRNAITCGGSLSYHPSGTRNFTPCELALLQGFPLKHKFSAAGTKKQIGNAFPPVVAKVFFEHIKMCLLRADGLM